MKVAIVAGRLRLEIWNSEIIIMTCSHHLTEKMRWRPIGKLVAGQSDRKAFRPKTKENSGPTLPGRGGSLILGRKERMCAAEVLSEKKSSAEMSGKRQRLGSGLRTTPLHVGLKVTLMTTLPYQRRKLIQQSRAQGTGEYFPPLQFHAEIVEVDIGGVAIYRTFREFRRAKSYCHRYGAQGQRRAYF
ncbi:hypothetical protein TNCV_494781 [Trichonephila clavipes]|nr:hypothetical protein TNCV_494781 [Trichonephila clavipes]